MHLSMRIGFVLGIAFILLSCGFFPVIGQDLSQNPPSGYDKGVWVLTGRTIEEGESEPNCGNPAFYTCPRPTISANSVVAPYSWNDGDGKCHGEVLYTTTWTALPSVLTPATKLETKLDVSATSQQTCGNRYVGASIEMGVTIGNSPWFRPQDGFARIDWPTSGPTPAPASAIAKWDVPWGKIGDVIVLKINPFFGYRVRIAYTYTYQGQEASAPALQPTNKEAENHPPTVTLDYSPEYPTDADAITLIASAEDPDGDQLMYSWFIGETEIGYETGTEIRRQLDPDDYEYTVKVSDGKGGTAEDTVRFTVIKKTPPPPCNGLLVNLEEGPNSVVIAKVVDDCEHNPLQNAVLDITIFHVYDKQLDKWINGEFVDKQMETDSNGIAFIPVNGNPEDMYRVDVYASKEGWDRSDSSIHVTLE
jgi:hypothetical protein